MTKVFCGTVRSTIVAASTSIDNVSDLIFYAIKPSLFYPMLSNLKSFLDAEELHRAERFHFEKDRNRFIICRAVLKCLLSKRTKSKLSLIKVEEIDVNKKPYLQFDDTVHFNLSHTNDLAIIAFANTDIGIDLEFLKKDYNFEEVLSHVYSKKEVDTILRSKNQRYAFYQFWTRKEAIVKATGEGINEYLLEIPAMDGHHSIGSHILKGVDDLIVLSFDLDDNHVASVAVSISPENINELNIQEIPHDIEEFNSFFNV